MIIYSLIDVVIYGVEAFRANATYFVVHNCGEGILTGPLLESYCVLTLRLIAIWTEVCDIASIGVRLLRSAQNVESLLFERVVIYLVAVCFTFLKERLWVYKEKEGVNLSVSVVLELSRSSLFVDGVHVDLVVGIIALLRHVL